MGYESESGNCHSNNENPSLLMNQLCKVCGEPAAGFHFGCFTCEGCKSFFGRTYNNVSGIAECKNGGRCEINKKNRTSCKSCRLRKCLRMGMSKSGSRYGRRSNWFKIHCLLQAQGQQNGMSSNPNETNNNSSSTTNHNNTNNNSSPNNYQNSFGKNSLPSTVTSYASGERDRDSGERIDRIHRSDRGGREERERTPSSSASRNGTNGLPPSGFTSLSSRLSPESLSSLNRKLNGPGADLADYFRAAGMVGKSMGGIKGHMYSEDGEDMSRTTRSPGSLESPRSETSMEDGKSSTPVFNMPPGSPLDVKPNDPLLSFDLITRDLMKMGYDPLRLWPAMFSAQQPNMQNLHNFNPYRFMFPNFPGAAAAFPSAGGFPPTPLLGAGVVPPQLLNGSVVHPATKQLYSAASLAQESSSSPITKLPHSLSAANLHHHQQQLHNQHHNHSSSRSHSHSPSSRSSPPVVSNSGGVRNRVTSIVPPSSSLTLTPPISHHGSDDPTSLFLLQQKIRSRDIPLQEKPIDLSAKSTNNNHVDVEYAEKISFSSRVNNNGDISEEDDDNDTNMCDNNDSDVDNNDEKDYNNSDVDMKNDNDEEDSDRGGDEDEAIQDLSSSSNNNNVTKSSIISSTKTAAVAATIIRRSSSCASKSPSSSPKRAVTPLDLTRGGSGGNSNSSPPLTKIAT